MKKWLYLISLLGLVLFFSCQKDDDYEKNLYGKGNGNGSIWVKANFSIEKSATPFASTTKKSGPATIYLKDNDTVWYQVWEFYRMADVAGVYSNIVFKWGSKSVTAELKDNDALTSYFSETKSGLIQLVVSADSAGIHLADTFNLVLSDDYPFIPSPGGYILDTSYRISARVWHYVWLISNNGWSPTTIQADGVKGRDVWFPYATTWSTKYPGYMRFEFDATDANYDPTAIVSADSNFCGNTIQPHSGTSNWFPINPDNIGVYYYHAGGTTAIGYVPYKGKLLPILSTSELPFITSSDNKVGIKADSVFFNYVTITDTNRQIHAIVNPSTNQFVNKTANMYSYTMWGGTAIAPIQFSAGGKNFIIINPLVGGTALDITGYALYNDSIGAIVIKVPAVALKSSQAKLAPISQQEASQLLANYPALRKR
jgi:hypothetical protein